MNFQLVQILKIFDVIIIITNKCYAFGLDCIKRVNELIGKNMEKNCIFFEKIYL